jgi:ABC-2 type transport system ATP-binding protein
MPGSTIYIPSRKDSTPAPGHATVNGSGGPLLETRDLVKVYKGSVRANDGISLEVREGEIFGLLGPNGAGKTTLVNQIIGLARPTSGSIVIAGVDVVSDPSFARQACSLQAQTQVPIAGLTARQAIELAGRIRGGGRVDTRIRTDRLIEALDIGEWAGKLGMTFSGGVRRLVAFAMAAVEPGRLVILDEPTNDVDPVRRRLLWQQVQGLAFNGSAVLLVTHNVLEAERAVDRLAVVDKGRVVATGTPAALKSAAGSHMRLDLALEPGREFSDVPSFLADPVRGGNRMLAHVRVKDISQAVAWAQDMKEQHEIEEFTLSPTTLEDVYVRIVGEEADADDGGAPDSETEGVEAHAFVA